MLTKQLGLKSNLLWLFLAALMPALFFLLGRIASREHFYDLIGIIFPLFIIYFLIAFKSFSQRELLFLLIVAIISRCLLFFAMPVLSDDFYRFIWDGKLIADGVSPYAILPSEWQNEMPSDYYHAIYSKLNSPDYYSIYPPTLQLLFYGAYTFAGDHLEANVFFMRLFILLAEIGSILIIIQLLKIYKLPESYVLVYALNPLVISESFAGLHFEAIMVFFLLLSVYCLHQKWLLPAAFFFACSIDAKLWPLFFLPALLYRMPFFRLVSFYLLVVCFAIVFFVPFYTVSLFPHFLSSVDLYFHSFEFNASVFYFVRAIGHWVTGWNWISITGTIFPMLFAGIILLRSIKKNTRNFWMEWQDVLVIYFILASVIHPWYLIPVMAMAVFSRYKSSLLWSLLIYLTYSAYSNNYNENYVFIAIEYTVFIGVYIYERFYYKNLETKNLPFHV